MTAREEEVRALRRRRPRDRVVRWSVVLLLGLCAGSWFLGDFPVRGLFAPGRGKAVASFLERATPRPVRDGPWDWNAVLSWAGDLMQDRGFEAALITLQISIAAIVLAALAGWLLALPASRAFATPAPFLPAPQPPAAALRFAWATCRGLTRTGLIFLRAIPEYVWAFLLFGILGPTAWPAVLALALHNAGILGRLGAETLENLPPAPMRALAALGAGRSRIALVAAAPAALPRFLLYFFYRWETCVREATVLGILGIVSLGYWIDAARHRFRYDELMLWILVGALIVLVGDLVSAALRAAVRRAS